MTPPRSHSFAAAIPIAATPVRFAESALPTRWGRFRLVVYHLADRDGEAMAIVAGDPAGDNTLARIHSECWTGETLGSLRCDCREQLERALAALAARGRGVIVYLRQEGRGIGLGNKIRAYGLQDRGADTVDANLALGLPVDQRTYELAGAILDDLDVRSVELMTNNASKLAALEACGIRVARRVPHWVAEHQHNHGYLDVKRERLGHLP